MICNKKGQGSFLSGDIPVIIMIVISIGFFLSSIYMATSTFEEAKTSLNVEAALVDAASAFLKENAKIKPSDLDTGSPTSFWSLRISKIHTSYGVQTYVELISLDPNSPACTHAGECVAGAEPPEGTDILSKRFPIALQATSSDLEVYPALVKVSVYVPRG